MKSKINDNNFVLLLTSLISLLIIRKYIKIYEEAYFLMRELTNEDENEANCIYVG